MANCQAVSPVPQPCQPLAPQISWLQAFHQDSTAQPCLPKQCPLGKLHMRRMPSIRGPCPRSRSAPATTPPPSHPAAGLPSAHLHTRPPSCRGSHSSRCSPARQRRRRRRRFPARTCPRASMQRPLMPSNLPSPSRLCGTRRRSKCPSSPPCQRAHHRADHRAGCRVGRKAAPCASRTSTQSSEPRHVLQAPCKPMLQRQPRRPLHQCSFLG